jgi:hypothetical protein
MRKRLHRLPWQSWHKQWGLDSADPDPEVEHLRKRVLLTSKFAYAALAVTLLSWVYLGLRGR